MYRRTDLALEESELLDCLPKGVESKEYRKGNIHVTRITVVNEAGAEALNKPIGQYVTIELPRFSEHVDDENRTAPIIAQELSKLLPKGSALVAGLGNEAITPDAVGPRTAHAVLATRHLRGVLEQTAGLDALRTVSVIAPGVMGNTGIESVEFLRGVIRECRPDFLIVIDALAAASVKRLGNTVQLCNSGISPGSGVHNARPMLSRTSLGIPVIAVGIPTVVDAHTLFSELSGTEPSQPHASGMIVTPREIDLLIRRAAHMVALAINSALQPTLSAKEILQLMA